MHFIHRIRILSSTTNLRIPIKGDIMLTGEALKKHNEKIKREKRRRRMQKVMPGGVLSESEDSKLDLRCIKLDAEWEGYGRA